MTAAQANGSSPLDPQVLDRLNQLSLTRSFTPEIDIDWDATTLAFQKVGYDGVWMFELAVAAERKPILEQASRARERLESLLHIGDEMLGFDEA